MGRARRAPERHRPGIIVTSLALDEFNGPRSGFYKNMFAKCPAGRPETNCQGLFNQIHKKSTKKVPEALYGS